MPLDLTKLRKLVAMDDSDALSRFALGQALFQQGDSPEALKEGAEHLMFANAKDPDHLATYHVLGQVLIQLVVLAQKIDSQSRTESPLSRGRICVRTTTWRCTREADSDKG